MMGAEAHVGMQGEANSEVERELKIGDVVEYIDPDGESYNALVIHVWANCLNVAYISKTTGDSSGNNILKATSVPYKQEGMEGNYIIR